LWEDLIQLPRPPPPPFDIKTMNQANRRGRRSRNESPMTNLTSTGSTVLGIRPILTQTGSTKARHGSPRKSNWTTAGRWFSNTPDPARRSQKNRCQKRSWQSGTHSYAHREWNYQKVSCSRQISAWTGDIPYQNTAHCLTETPLSSPLPPQPPFPRPPVPT
jgi:hypothetical protein